MNPTLQKMMLLCLSDTQIHRAGWDPPEGAEQAAERATEPLPNMYQQSWLFSPSWLDIRNYSSHLPTKREGGSDLMSCDKVTHIFDEGKALDFFTWT